jgi:tetratricopeptide (TPR) repeat protein
MPKKGRTTVSCRPRFCPLRAAAFLLGCLAAGPGQRAQAPAPGGDVAAVGRGLVRAGELRLDAEDPLQAWSSFREALRVGADGAPCRLGLGRTHLMLGESAFALAYAEAVLRHEPANQDGMALCVRALIRARRFDEAVARANVFAARVADRGVALQAARGSALFRVQRIDEAAAAYRAVVALEPLHAEANLRLGSGLLPPG